MAEKSTLTIPLPLDRDLFFAKQVDQESIEVLSKDIVKINENDHFLEKYYTAFDLVYKRPPIKIYIDSYGGNVYQIFGVINIIESSKTPIHTICTGTAMSCGFMLLISGHRRFAYKYSTPLYHQVSWEGIGGKIADTEQRMVEFKRMQDIIEEMTLRKTKITKKKLAQIYKEKVDWFMTSAEAKRLGVIDEIL
jgi:ATP-dependent Clp protease protease subunit